MSNDYFNVEIESNYGYISKDSPFDTLYQRTVNFQLFFQNGLETGMILDEDLNLIAKEMENTAKQFAISQGLGPGQGNSLLHFGKDGSVTSIASKGPTGNLYSHIKAVRDKEKIELKNDAKNSRGQYYAGHIEFGHRSRNGGMVPARPFMRPALYAVADASKGQLSGTLMRYLENIWALETLQFGSLNISRGRVREFYKNAMNPQAKNYGRYTSRQLPKGRLKEMSQTKHRERQTVYRDMRNKFSREVGSRMGYKAGQKDQRGAEHLSTTTWHRDSSSRKTSNSIKSSVSQTNRQRGASHGSKNVDHTFTKQERQSLASFLGSGGSRFKESGSNAAHGRGSRGNPNRFHYGG